MESNLSSPTILIVEDNPSSAIAIESAIEIIAEEIGSPYSISTVDNFEEAEQFLQTGSFPNLAIVDMEILQHGRTQMPAGFFLIKQFIENSLGTEWIAITGHRLLTSTPVGEDSLADALFELPLLGIWYKDDFQELSNLLRTFFATFSSTTPGKLDVQPRFAVQLDDYSFVTNDGKLYFRIRQGARSEANILLFGERGTQKEAIAKAIHYVSNRNQETFSSIDHSTLTADNLQIGSLKLLQQLSNGTLYINGFDLIDEARRRQIVGTCSPREGYNIRVIGGIDADISKPVAPPSSSENFLAITIPPLSERHSDIPLLVSYFLNQYNSNAKIIKALASPDNVYDFLQNCRFPDNETGVRRFVDDLINMRPGKTISLQDVINAYQRLYGSFGFISVDTNTCQVLRGGWPLAKQPSDMEFKLMTYLLENEGRVCSKDEIIEAVWPGDVQKEGVSDDSIAQLIKRLRDIVEFDPSIHRYIRTRRGQGYQFVQYRL